MLMGSTVFNKSRLQSLRGGIGHSVGDSVLTCCLVDFQCEPIGTCIRTHALDPIKVSSALIAALKPSTFVGQSSSSHLQSQLRDSWYLTSSTCQKVMGIRDALKVNGGLILSLDSGSDNIIGLLGV